MLTAKLPIIAFILALTIAVGVTYKGVSNHGFLNYDDDIYVTDNAMVTRGLTFESLHWAFGVGYESNWIPLSWLSHMLDVELFGLNPRGHHWTSLFWHWVNSILVFFFLRLAAGGFWRPALAASLFALHPLHVESVAWISERKDVLSCAFFLISLICYVQYANKKMKWAYLLALLSFACGLMAKPMVITLPALLLLLDFWPLRRFSPPKNKRLLLEKTPFFLAALFSGIMTIYAQSLGQSLVAMTTTPFSSRLTNALQSYALYLWKTFWPVNLSPYYPFPNDFSFKSIAISVGALIGITLLTIRFRRYSKAPLVGWLWFIISLMPVIGIVQVGEQAMADRYTYIPHIGLFFGMVWWLPEGTKSHRASITTLAVAILTILGLITAGQVDIWHDQISLFSHAVKVTKNNAVAYFHLGSAYARKEAYSKAQINLEKALVIEPQMGKAYLNLGYVLDKQEKTQAAALNYRKALQLRPKDTDALFNLGLLHMRNWELQKSASLFRRILSLHPDHVLARQNLARVTALQNAQQTPGQTHRSR